MGKASTQVSQKCQHTHKSNISKCGTKPQYSRTYMYIEITTTFKFVWKSTYTTATYILYMYYHTHIMWQDLRKTVNRSKKKHFKLPQWMQNGHLENVMLLKVYKIIETHRNHCKIYFCSIYPFSSNPITYITCTCIWKLRRFTFHVTIPKSRGIPPSAC